MELIKINYEYDSEYYYVYCPICERYREGSSYLYAIFPEEKTLWIANMITHYRHNHTNWDKSNYRLHSKSKNGYNKDKAAVNEYIKQLLIRKYSVLLKENKITSEHFGKLQNTTTDTLKLADTLLT
jgi:hypothetical protein